jgi:hypothetical protein
MRILLVACRYPWPPRRGDQVRALQCIEALGGRHEVTLLAPEPATGQPPVPNGLSCRVELYRRRLAGHAAGLARALGRGLPLQSGLFLHSDLGSKLRRLAPEHELVVLQTVRLAAHLRDVGDALLLMDFIDCLSLNFASRAACDRPWLRPLLRVEAGRLASWEGRLLGEVAGAMAVCRRDLEELARRGPGQVADRLLEVPVAVEPSAASLAEGPGERSVLAITGNLGYFANHDAVSWWLREVWPLLRQARPGLEMVIAGDRPSRALKSLIQGAGARLMESPPDLGQVLAGATLSLAPMRCGSGVPMKVLESWRAGVPVVASPWAAAGTAGKPGEELAVAGDPRQWVETVSELLADSAQRRRLAAAGRARLERDYSLETVRRNLLEAVDKAVQSA